MQDGFYSQRLTKSRKEKTPIGQIYECFGSYNLCFQNRQPSIDTQVCIKCGTLLSCASPEHLMKLIIAKSFSIAALIYIKGKQVSLPPQVNNDCPDIFPMMQFYSASSVLSGMLKGNLSQIYKLPCHTLVQWLSTYKVQGASIVALDITQGPHFMFH